MRLIPFLLVFAFTAIAYAQGQADFLQASNWEGMWGSPPATQAGEGASATLQFDCNFEATKAARASWDCRLHLDLSRSPGVHFEIKCDDPAPVGGWSVYFQSSDGWYATTISPGAAGKWATVWIRKEDTGIEGTPSGWSNITAIRVSAWRGQPRDTRFALRGFSVEPQTPGIFVVRGESAASTRRNELETVKGMTQRMCLALHDLGLPCSMLSDLDLTPQRVGGVPLLVLPHNPVMPADSTKAVIDYMQSGGKVAAFYAMPGEIAQAGGMRNVRHVPQTRPGSFAEIAANMQLLPGAPERTKQGSWNIQLMQPTNEATQVAAEWLDSSGNRTGMPAICTSPSLVYMSHVLLQDDPARKGRLLLAMVGKLWPEAWKIAAENSLDQSGRIAQYASFDAAAEDLSRSPASADAIGRARELRTSAANLVREQKYPEAIDATAQIRAAMTDAYARAQSPAANEFRALWCHRANGIEGMSWDESITLLADNGFTAIIPNMCWGGVAFYPSDVLPVAPSVAEHGDYLKECLDAAGKHGLQVHVWKVNWNMGWQAPREFMDRMKRDGRTQVSFDGKTNDQWLCPSHPANQQLEIDAMVEVASKYDVDGIHFDYIRYPGPDGCFCAGCRERFEKAIGKKIADWPADVRRDESQSLLAQWNDFRRNNITRVVASVAEKVHALGKPTKISAAVFNNWPVDRDSVGQDWKLWCERGYLDFVCPMDYTSSNDQFRIWAQNQLKWAGKVPVYPGIGLSTWSGPRRDLVKLIDQIKIAREVGTKGFVIFEYNADESREIVPLCGVGITRK